MVSRERVRSALKSPKSGLGRIPFDWRLKRNVFLSASQIPIPLNEEGKAEKPSEKLTSGDALDKEIPLCVDLDGTLVGTDIFLESAIQLIKSDPLYLVKLVLWYLSGGRAFLKARVAALVEFDVTSLPYNVGLLSFLKKERIRGRKVYLVTAAAHQVANQIARYTNVFSGVFSSTETSNLRARKKRKFLVKTFGSRGYDYVGNDKDDITVWRYARQALVVNANQRVIDQAKRAGNVTHVVSKRNADIRSFTKALRIHQWLKNVLVFMPMFLANRIEFELLVDSFLAFFAFSFCASSGYIFNDILDLSSDRRHDKKRHRPFASGTLSLMFGFKLIPLLFCLGVLVSLTLPLSFTGLLIAYYFTSLAYTLRLKKIEVVDVVLLAGFYTLRLFGGAEATGVMVSSWLLAFSSFFFLSLALIKRSSELSAKIAKGNINHTISRGYVVRDHPQLLALGSASGFMSVVVLALYINSEAVAEIYSKPHYLWILCVMLTYWISRYWLLANRGEISHDPVLHAMKDRVSYVVLTLVLIGWLMARGF
jgi:4-hydroxybenzoate polyprenyltransferase